MNYARDRSQSPVSGDKCTMERLLAFRVDGVWGPWRSSGSEVTVVTGLESFNRYNFENLVNSVF